eukprot:1417859-Pleurochrysis_carterae.AAC.2
MRTSNVESRQGLVELQRLRQNHNAAIPEIAACAPTQIHAVVQTHALAKHTHANRTVRAAAQLHTTF